MQLLIGQRICHKDGATGVIVGQIRGKTDFYMVRFDDGVTIAAHSKNLRISEKSLNADAKASNQVGSKSVENKRVTNGAETTSSGEQIRQKLDEGVQIVLVTGEAGTGKSTLIEELKVKLPGNTAVLAFTGVAARQIRGETIHSFFGFPITVLDTNAIGDPRNREKIGKLKYLVIDEVSMLRADVLDAVCRTLTSFGPQKGEPLGGVRLILVGDFMQLPPVLESDDEARGYFYSKYYSSYFFEAKVFEDVEVAFFNLTYRHRQSEDPEFGELLSRMRIGETTSDDIDRINRLAKSSGHELLRSDATWLTNTNERVEEINQGRLSLLEGSTRNYLAAITGEFLPQNYPTQSELLLKKGARVVLVRNDLEKSRRWYNGSVATVTELSEHSIELIIHETQVKVSVQRSMWETYKYFYDREKDQLDCVPVGQFEQFPLALAWATTIHKSQGKTLSSIYLDLPADYRVMPSQLYVALSRTKSLERVAVSRDITLSDVQVNKRALQAWRFLMKHNEMRSKLHIPVEAAHHSGNYELDSLVRGTMEDTINVVQNVIDEGGRLYMDYISKTGRKWRVVKPQEWLQKGILFEAYCEENEENRSFRIDRIHDLKVL